MTEIDEEAPGSADGGGGAGGAGGAGGSDGLRPGDPALRDAMVTLVDAMVGVAGSNRRLSELSGVSEATLRNYRRGTFPRTSIASAVQLDTWAAGAVADDPGPGQPGSLSDSLARWQGRLPVQLEGSPAEAGPESDAGSDTDSDAASGTGGTSAPSARRPRRLLVPLLSGAVLALALVVALLAAQAADDGSTASGVAGVRVDRDVALDTDNFCGWTTGSHPIPLVSAKPLVMRVDARCNAPAEPDPVVDVGTSVYAGPTNDDPADKVGAIRSGNTFVPQCWQRSGDVVEDASEEPNRSDIWIRSEQPAGFLPDVNVGGGYTERQLTALGLPRC